MSPEQFDGWLAYWKVEPDAAQQIERIREILKEGFAAMCAVQGAKVKPAYFDPVKEEVAGEAQTSAECVTPAQAALAFSVFAGAPAGEC